MYLVISNRSTSYTTLCMCCVEVVICAEKILDTFTMYSDLYSYYLYTFTIAFNTPLVNTLSIYPF